MNEHWLLYTSDREHGGTKILSIFNTAKEAEEYYYDFETDKYWNICHIEGWQNDKKIKER